MSTLRIKDLDKDPFKQFEKWFLQALQAKVIEPNAFTLATVSSDLKPSQRTVLLKIYDKDGFLFFSNTNSKKVDQIEQNPNISAHFAWLGIERQIRIEGTIKKVPNNKLFRTFLIRPKGNNLGSWISHQSQIINSRSLLEMKFDQMRKKFAKKQIPFPSLWSAFQIVPDYFEYWQGSKDQLHERFVYKLVHNSWQLDQLDQ